MKINIISVNHKLSDWLEQGIQDYSCRLNKWAINFIQLKPSNKINSDERMLNEAKNIERSLVNLLHKSLIIVLDEKGFSNTTKKLAENITNWQYTYCYLTFIIGGADGLHQSIKQKANYILRLSDMTLPHGFAQLLLIEQLYRVYSMMNNHPYHRE